MAGGSSSLAVRLAAAFVGLVAAVALVFVIVGFAAAESGVTGQVDLFLENRAEELVEGERDRPQRKNRGDEDVSVAAPTFDADSVVQTLTEDGRPEASSGVALPVDVDDLTLAASSSDATRLRTVDIDGSPFRLITAAVPGGGAVQVARPLDETNSAIDLIRNQLAVAVPIVAVLAGLAGLLLARRITKPLRSLTASVDEVAATGDLSVPIEVSGDDEVAHLANGFDNLLRSLARSRRQQQQLVQDAAHELRTPLTSVRANVDLLAAAPDLEPEIRSETLGSVRRELRELSRLVNEIVEVATDRFAPQDFVEVDLGSVANEAIDRFRARRPHRTVETSIESVIVRGHGESLIRATGNLLANADKYSPQDRSIRVTVTAGRLVAVADNGPGIAPAERERVFDRFYRADEARNQPGSGLGLAIVASIVEAHGGAVAVGDNPGGGAVVSFTLPG